MNNTDQTEHYNETETIARREAARAVPKTPTINRPKGWNCSARRKVF
jgi:hypothetical protein